MTLVVAGLVGLVTGSYAVTAGIRLSRAEAATFGRSRCDNCGVVLSFASTVPILSFIQAGGRCRTCRARIDRLHLSGEVAGALVLAGAVLLGPWRGLLVAVLGLTLIAASAVDMRVGRLPNALTAAVAAVCLALASTRSMQALAGGLLAAAICTLLLLALREIRRRGGKDAGLGLGDVKLLAALAIWLGAATPWAICAAAVLGLTWVLIKRPENGRLAFGPMIALAAWISGLGMELAWWPMTR